ncbi:MAG: hypothetical protein Q9187_000474 [Circinaria calcarea]
MAFDLQTKFRKLRVETATPIADRSTEGPILSRDNDHDYTAEIRQAAGSGWDFTLQPAAAYNRHDLSSPAAAGPGRDGIQAFTPPINVPSHSADSSASRRYEIEPLIHEERYHEPSPLEGFLQSRKTSISFDPKPIFHPGHSAAIEQSSPKLNIKTRSRGRSLLKELAKRPLRSPLERAHSEADRTSYDPITGEFTNSSTKLTYAGREKQLFHSKSRYPLLQTTVDDLALEDRSIDSERAASLTSQTTASSIAEEVSTPSDGIMECLTSPIQLYSPYYHPTSLEESSAWPKPRRQASASRAKTFTYERNASLRQGRRSGSRRSSSSLSPATAFLSKWNREEAPLSPDDEGQEVGEYVLGKEIGFGGFSVVREAFTVEGENRICRAVKVVRRQLPGKDELENERLQTEFEHEISLWRCLSHRHILPLIAVHITDFATYCFTQLNTGGTLFDLIRVNRQGLRKDLARRYTYQLASAIRYLHEDVRVVHRDIKLENCLIDFSHPDSSIEGGNLLLCDFGLSEFITSDTRSNSPDVYDRTSDRPSSRSIGPSDTSTSIAGSLQYASPELILSPAGLLNPAVDIWAFGVVVYALLVGDLPFQHMFQPRVQMMILAGDWNREALAGAGEDVQELVKGCLCMDWEERWTIGRVLDCAWLNGCREMLEEISGGWRP